MTLQRTLSVSMLTLLTIALGAAAALVVLTTQLHDATARLGAAMGNVQLAEELLVDLRAIDAMTARLGDANQVDIRNAISRRSDLFLGRLAELDGRAQTPIARELLEEARRSVDRYVGIALSDRTGPGELADMRSAFDDARGVVRRFLDLNVERARGERARAARFDDTADAWGMGAAAVLLIGTVAVLAFLRRRLFRPMFALAESISRYGSGNTAERAPERGFEELRDIARSFNDVADRLERQRADQLAFLAGVAHDLGTPLQAIRLACRSLEDSQHSQESPHLPASKLEIIDRQVTKLSRMASDFLDASRAEAGRLDLVLEPRDLRDVLHAAAGLFSGTSKAHRLEIAEPPGAVMVRCDMGRIEQVVNNLVGNAFKYSPEGGSICLTLGRDGSSAVLAVRDEGVGIAPEDLTTIFEPFRRGSRLAKAVPGLGLGLATSRRIAECHGGSLNVSSTPGLGSTFELRLPLDVR